MICVEGYIGKWSSGNERKDWENGFNETLIDPVTTNIETVLRNTYTLAMKGILKFLIVNYIQS